MTTSVVTNSVFRGFFEKQKLTGPNFIDWYRQLRIVLSVEDKLDYLEQPIPPAPVPAQAGQQVAPEALAAHTAWVKGSKEIVGLMLMTMEPDIQQNLENLSAYDMLQELKTLFAQQAEQELLQTVRDFHSCKQEEGQSVSSYVLKMKSYIDNLERLGHPVSLNLGVSLILISLRKEFDSFVQNYNMHSMGKTVNELHAMLKLHEQTLTKKDPALHAIRAGKVQKKNNKQKKSQVVARGQNQGKGKSKLAYAPKPKIPPLPKRENPAKDSVCHQCGDTGHWKRNCPQYLAELLKTKKLSQGASGSGALSLYMGNGQRVAVKAIGTYHLCLPSGLVIVLNNCHYAPSITRGIILVSRLYDDGYVNCFMDNTIQVSRNNMVYFSVVPRDGIFEIDLSNPNAIDSSMYAVSNKRAKLNLDSALLWHCRLGHISKKRIEKLQHDGLLNSTDLRDFEKCVPCMSGKMARKPYTHQVERAKDLLGLIHIDGEYMSQEFLDHLKEHGIIAHHTPPYTPQHNGISEMRNRNLLDMLRFMMSQTTLPNSFWDYAFETATRILNMVSTKKGCEALVKRDTLTKPDKLEPRSIKCIFVGYPKETMGYSFYYPPENKVLVAQNAKFLEKYSHHEEDDLEIYEPQSDIIPIPRSMRTRNAPNFICLYIDAEEHELGDHDEPANYKAALLDLESDKWLSKTDMDGAVHTYKVHLVAKRYTQTPRVDNEDTFSPIADIRAIRILVAIAAFHDYEI
ncbi:zinc finger, CCHC-type containing protein [Tanacetum coccineum]